MRKGTTIAIAALMLLILLAGVLKFVFNVGGSV